MGRASTVVSAASRKPAACSASAAPSAAELGVMTLVAVLDLP